MMLQLGFGLSALRSGLLTFSSGVAALAVKATTVQILRQVGYRRAMISNSILGSIFLALCALFRPVWPVALLYAVLLLGGFVRSLQQVSGTAGISISAAILAAAVLLHGRATPDLTDFSLAFTAVALISAGSVFYCLKLDHEAGAELSGRPLA